MTTFFSKHMCRLIAGTLAVSSFTMMQAAAGNPLSVRLSPNVKAAVGRVLTAEDIMTAEQAFSRAQKIEQATVEAVDTATAAAAETTQATPSATNAASEQALKDAAANTQAAADAQAQTADVEKSREEALKKAKAKEEARLKEQEIAREKQKAEAAAKAEAEAKALAAQDLSRPYDRIVYEDRTNGTVSSSDGSSSTSGASTIAPEIQRDRKVGYSSAFSASDDVSDSATLLGNFKLTFYCPCETCNGRGDAKTSSGTTMVEGRTIAVDSSVIPLGSRVYIDGFGEFIAEDTGSAIIDKRIDICVSTHEQAYALGVTYGDVYLLN